jgi:hypothetical protein
MGDWAGGLILAGGYLAGDIVFLSGLGREGHPEGDEFLVFSGLALGLATNVYSFVRPFSYDKALAKKNGTYFAELNSNPLEHINIALLPDNKGEPGVNLSYSLHF